MVGSSASAKRAAGEAGGAASASATRASGMTARDCSHLPTVVAVVAVDVDMAGEFVVGLAIAVVNRLAEAAAPAAALFGAIPTAIPKDSARTMGRATTRHTANA